MEVNKKVDAHRIISALHNEIVGITHCSIFFDSRFVNTKTSAVVVICKIIHTLYDILDYLYYFVLLLLFLLILSWTKNCYICDLQFNWCLPPPPPPTLSHVFRLMADLSKFNMRERITTLQSSKEPFWRTPRKVGQSPGTMAIHGTAEKIAIHEIGNRDDW